MRMPSNCPKNHCKTYSLIAARLHVSRKNRENYATVAATDTLTIQDSLSSFTNPVIWLVVIAFFISRGFIKTGLGARIAYLFVAKLGKKHWALVWCRCNGFGASAYYPQQYRSHRWCRISNPKSHRGRHTGHASRAGTGFF
jgi:hypothetical protein